MIDKDDDPEPVTLTWLPPRRRTARSILGWVLLGAAVGIMAGWTLFL